MIEVYLQIWWTNNPMSNRGHILEDVSPVPEISYSQIWGINIVAIGDGKPNCPKK